MINNLLEKLITYENLTEEEAYTGINLIMGGKLTQLQIASVMIDLRIKASYPFAYAVSVNVNQLSFCSEGYSSI